MRVPLQPDSFPKPPKRADTIAEAIKRLIVEQSLKPGDRLPSEKELIVQFGSSRGTTREALRTLEIQGLIERSPGPKGGTRVGSALPPQTMQLVANYLYFKDITPTQIYMVRVVLEPLLAESVVGLLSAQDFAALEDCVVESKRYLEGQSSAGDCRQAELRFHQVLTQVCPNPFLSFLCQFIIYMLVNFLQVRGIDARFDQEFTRTCIHYHERLIEAFREKDNEAVGRLMADHMREAFAYIKSKKGLFENTLLSPPGFMLGEDW